jgi:hypothetical protein
MSCLRDLMICRIVTDGTLSALLHTKANPTRAMVGAVFGLNAESYTYEPQSVASELSWCDVDI